MRVEDGGVLRAQLVGDCIAIGLNFRRRSRRRLRQALQLVIDRIVRNEPPRDAKSLVIHHQDFANGDAG